MWWQELGSPPHLSVPSTQSAFIEWQRSIHKCPSPPKILKQTAENKNKGDSPSHQNQNLTNILRCWLQHTSLLYLVTVYFRFHVVIFCYSRAMYLYLVTSRTFLSNQWLSQSGLLTRPSFEAQVSQYRDVFMFFNDDLDYWLSISIDVPRWLVK